MAKFRVELELECPDRAAADKDVDQLLGYYEGHDDFSLILVTEKLRCNCTAQGSVYNSGCPVHDPRAKR